MGVNGLLKRNLIANYLGQGWQALMAIAFVPLYIKFLGVEAYGLIGIFAVLQASMGLLDMGMKASLGREMACFLGGGHDAQYVRDLLRSIEIVVIATAVLAALGIAAASGSFASSWIRAETLPKETVHQAIIIMGLVVSLRFVENIYVSCMIGLQHQVLQNIVSVILSTLRGVGSVGVLTFVSPTTQAFFIWQGLVSLIAVSAFAYTVYDALPKIFRPAQFSYSALLNIWRFAAGMTGITFLAFLLTQADKVLLSRLLSLKAFGYYSLAWIVASNLLQVVTAPIFAAFYPQFIELVARRDPVALGSTYHQAAQLITVLAGSTAIVLISFGDKSLLLWTRDPVLTEAVYPLMSVIALGYLFNCLMSIPTYLQLAYGWTSLTFKLNAVAVCVLVPGIVIAVTKYGAIGAAWLWVSLNAGCLVLGIYYMHKRLIPQDKWRWYRSDVAIPLAAAAVTAGLCRWISPADLDTLATFTVLAFSSALVLTGAALTAPMVRNGLLRGA